MGFFGEKKMDDEHDVPVPTVTVSGVPGQVKEPLRVGIDHAITLMRSLPTGPGQDVDLVVTVLKKTLESLNIRVADIVSDASRRQHDIETRVGVLKAEIKTLEGEVEARVNEIRRLEAAHEETTRVKDFLRQKGGEDASGSPSPVGSGPSS